MKKLLILPVMALMLTVSTLASAQGLQGQEFSALDINGDGVLSFEELAVAGVDEETFRLIDTDANGTVSEAEFSAYVAQTQNQ